MSLEFILKDLLDVLILGYILYRVILLFAETRALRLAYGIAILIGVYFLAKELNFTGLLGLFGTLDTVTIGVVVLAILFASEIREALARLGTGARARFREQREEERKVIEEVVRVCQSLSRRKVGALIVLQRDDGLEDYIRSGVPLDSQVSAPLLESLFHRSSPLHDGAVVIRGNRLIAAKCILPLSESLELKREGVGTRHRAALGLAEKRDAAVLVVSEERGTISLAESGKMLKFPEERRLYNELMTLFVARMKKAQRRERFKLGKAIFGNFHWKVVALALSLFIWAFRTQDLAVETAISFNRGNYPTSPSEIRDGDTVVLDPQELLGARLTLNGLNWRLYQVILGLSKDPEYLKDKVKIEDSPRPGVAKSESALLVRHLGEAKGGEGEEGEEGTQRKEGTKVKEKVTFHEGGPAKSCERCTDRSRSEPRQGEVILHVAKVARIPKTSVGIRVYGRDHLPEDYEAQSPVIDFKDSEEPLICFFEDRARMMEEVADCETIPIINIKDKTEPYELKGVLLKLPPRMRGIALNRDGKVVNEVVIPIRSGEPPLMVAEAERIRDQARDDAAARETKSREEVEEIQRQRELVDSDEFLKTLDLGRLTRAKESLEDCMKDIEDGRARLEEIDRLLDRDKEEKLLGGIPKQAKDQLNSYIASTEKWKEELEGWVTILEEKLEPVSRTKQDLVEQDGKIEEAKEGRETAKELADNVRSGEDFQELSRALEERLDSLKALPDDPVARLEEVAALFPAGGELAASWHGLERGLQDKRKTAREMRDRVHRVAEKAETSKEARFPALAKQELDLAAKQLLLSKIISDTVNHEIRAAKVLYDKTLKSLEDEQFRENSSVRIVLGSLEKELPGTGALGPEARGRLEDLLKGKIQPALVQVVTERKKVDKDAPEVERALADLTQETVAPSEGAELTQETVALWEGELEDLGDAREKARDNEEEALTDLKARLKKRLENLDLQEELLQKSKRMATALQNRLSSPPPREPRAPGESTREE